MIQTTIKLNDLQAKIEEAGEEAEIELEQVLRDIARYATNISPVDTGAFVESWSFSETVVATRRYSSSTRLKASQNQRLSMRATSERNLNRDIDVYVDEDDFDRIPYFYFINGAPHASSVDLRHGIVARIRNRFRG